MRDLKQKFFAKSLQQEATVTSHYHAWVANEWRIALTSNFRDSPTPSGYRANNRDDVFRITIPYPV
ncbi:hypothetical protein J6590_027583 [Homalodisca vitripennis]|nr:hypothetical protein J6590_027583 [Homalodisca vitripennis]